MTAEPAAKHDSALASEMSVMELLEPTQRGTKRTSRIRKAQVAVVMGSESDLTVMQDALDVLDRFGIRPFVEIISAHRTPRRVSSFSEGAADAGFKVIIAGAGGAAHLPGMVAAHTFLPVIGVPVPTRHLGGQDSLYSIVQMPAGVPVATVSIGGAGNAAILALQILATSDKRIRDMLKTFKEQLETKVAMMNERVNGSSDSGVDEPARQRQG